jgi:hypothetical protein
MDFSQLKKNRDALRQKLHDKVENLNTNSNFTDDRFWELKTDKSGTGTAIIRFLMAPEGEDFPFTRFWEHAFKGPGGWCWQNCLTSIGKDCPICQANSVLWNTEIEANKEVARKRKRKLKYVANILVVKDPKSPENNGKVFLFKFGAKIFEKLNDLMSPVVEGVEPQNPFDFWEGSNFQLIQTKGEGGYPNYDKSKFDNISAISAKDKDIEAIWKQEHKLAEFLDPKKFLSEADLKAKFEKAVGNVATGTKAKTAEDLEEQVVAPKKTKTKAAKEQPKVEPEDEAPFDNAVDSDPTPEGDEDLLAQFSKLANDD